MISDWFIYLLSVLLGLYLIAILQLQGEIKKLKHDAFVLSQLTGRFDMNKKIVFRKILSPEQKGPSSKESTTE